MRGAKLILLGIAVLLLGVNASLLSGLQLPTYHNWLFELLGLVCPAFGIMLAVWGVFARDGGEDGGDAGESRDRREDS